MSLITCNICYSDNYYSLSPRALRYNICKECGHVYQAQLYEKNYYHSLQCSFPKDYKTHATRRAKYIVDFVKSCYDKPICTVLDVGCGPGEVISNIQRLLPNAACYGCTLEATDKPFIYRSDIENDALPNRKFDLIILSHVMEHFLNPIKTMSKIRHSLSKDGIIYIETPSFYWGEIRSESIFTPEHFSYYTITSIQNTIGLAGLTSIKIKESRYWGNIKLVCRSANEEDFPIKKVDYRKVMCYSRGIKLLYPWFKLIRRVKTIGPNE